jgi:NAD(P)H-flavin reductase
MSGHATSDLYVPMPAGIAARTTETRDVDTLRLRAAGGKMPAAPVPGQFMVVSVLGVGECPISVSAAADDGSWVELSIRTVGRVTGSLRDGAHSGALGLRGPFGRGFDLDGFAGRPLVCIAGGIGLAPLRPLVRWALGSPRPAAPVAVLYGARTPGDRLYTDELRAWTREADCVVEIVESTGGAAWDGPVGRVTDVLDRLGRAYANAAAAVCGPGPMLAPVVRALEARQVAAADIQLAMERRMSCGVGKCGHCYIGEKLVCTDGPVFTACELRALGEPL